jgi:hypothetical protein
VARPASVLLHYYYYYYNQQERPLLPLTLLLLFSCRWTRIGSVTTDKETTSSNSY